MIDHEDDEPKYNWDRKLGHRLGDCGVLISLSNRVSGIPLFGVPIRI